MLELLPDSLWIGNAQDARNPQQLLAANVKSVIDLAAEEAPAQLPRDFSYFRIPIVDGESNTSTILRRSVMIVTDLLMDETPVLVACSAGMSRSPTIAAHAISIQFDNTPEEIVASISNRRTLEINDKLWIDVANAVRDVSSRRVQ